MSGITAQAINLSQSKVKTNIRRYLERKGRSPQLIEQFQEGYCHGLAVLAAYGQYLSSQPTRRQPCDDWEWFSRVLTQLANWHDEPFSLSIENEKDIDRFISQIEFFQHISSYLPSGQGSLDQYLVDTQHRTLTQEYTIGGLFCADDFTKPLLTRDKQQTTSLIDELLKYDQRIIIVSCGGHTISLFNDNDSVTLYDSNYPAGLQRFSRQSPQALVRAIYKAYRYDTALPSPIGFRLFSFSSQPGEYVSPADILSQLNTPLSYEYPGNRKNYTALHIAARVGSAGSVAYFLEQGANTRVEDNDGYTPRQVARGKRLPEIADMIQYYRQPVNDRHYGDQHALLFTSITDEQKAAPDVLPDAHRPD
jgi:hypothetical protein